ncbi:MAG: asparaginase domain-containing protein, partial [Nanoarchaeota archaeon]
MAKIQIGDYIEVVTSSGNIKGNLMPSTTNKVIVKLDNGYNIGISRDKIKRVVLIKKAQTRREKLETVKEKKGLPVISILHTGGTVASKVDYNTGAVTASYDPEELVAMFPELGEIANIRSRLISNMFSEDMRFSHYNLIAKEIKKEIMRGVNGIIITHGTDTITYTAAALAFI